MAPLLALIAACSFAFGIVPHQKGTLETNEPEETGTTSSWLLEILKKSVWLGGLLLQVAVWVLQAVALDLRPLLDVPA